MKKYNKIIGWGSLTIGVIILLTVFYYKPDELQKPLPVQFLQGIIVTEWPFSIGEIDTNRFLLTDESTLIISDQSFQATFYFKNQECNFNYSYTDWPIDLIFGTIKLPEHKPYFLVIESETYIIKIPTIFDFTTLPFAEQLELITFINHPKDTTDKVLIDDFSTAILKFGEKRSKI